MAWIPTPVSLLLTRQLSASAKLLWMAARANAQGGDPGGLRLNQLAVQTGLGRATAYRVRAKLEETGWWKAVRRERIAPARTADGSRLDQVVHVPSELIGDPTVSAQGRVLYGVLRKFFVQGKQEGECTYAQVRSVTSLDVRTIKRAMGELDRSGWIQASQANQMAPVKFAFRNPTADQRKAEVARVRRRVEKAPFRGEALMREYLSRLVDSDDFEDDASPGFLVNPMSGERMQLDRFYPNHRVAFEFNGPQHYRLTERFSSEEELAKQQARDLMKIGICVLKKIPLVILHPEDLTLETMRKKVEPLLPIRKLDRNDAVLRHLESLSRVYRRRAG